MSSRGFTLIEVLIYSLIFAVSAVFLVGILTTVTETQIRQSAINEVGRQISFVSNQIQRLVRESSLIENAVGVASETLTLRMENSALDPTLVYLDGDEKVVYLKEGANDPLPLTGNEVEVTHFSVTKFEPPGGLAVAQVNLTVVYKSDRPRTRIAKSWQGAISRISAATFDGDIIPNLHDALNVGGASQSWQDGFFSRDLRVMRRMGLGTDPSSLSTMKLKSVGDIGFTTSTAGIVLMSPGGTCYRLTVTNAGAIATSTATCP